MATSADGSGSDAQKKVYNAKGDPRLRATRQPTFDQWRSQGVKAGDKTFKLNHHAYKSLSKSGRKDIMPVDILDALSTTPQPGSPGSVEYVNPSTGTSVFVNPDTNEIVGVWPGSFKR